MKARHLLSVDQEQVLSSLFDSQESQVVTVQVWDQMRKSNSSSEVPGLTPIVTMTSRAKNLAACSIFSRSSSSEKLFLFVRRLENK